MTDPYAVDAPYYDLVNRFNDDDVGLWLSFAGRTTRPVLEVGAGTGRIAIQLALHGHRVTALDPSPAMLAIARQKADNVGATLTLIEAAVAEASLEPEHYGLVLIPADVFLYCPHGEAQLEMLRILRAAMTFDALLAIDLPGPAMALDPGTNGQPLVVFAGETDLGEPLDVVHLREDDLAAQSRLLRVTYERTSADGIVRRATSEHTLRYPYRFEMEYLLHLAGLALVDVYGDYELGPLTNDSERMIFIARRVTG